MLIFRSRIVPWLMKALANVGQMAFTNYLVQSIICTWFFYGYGFDNYNRLRFTSCIMLYSRYGYCN
ncbi:MAG: DUF418 domain-containing protein [Bacteroidota bacterium]